MFICYFFGCGNFCDGMRCICIFVICLFDNVVVFVILVCVLSGFFCFIRVFGNKGKLLELVFLNVFVSGFLCYGY